MGNQPCALPDGTAGQALRQMTGPSRIDINDSFWFELLKAKLPGVEEAAFLERHYAQPEELDALVHSEYFLQLVATNEQSGNFRTFLRFWTRLLHYYRTSPRDAKPCEPATILTLSLLCRCLLKQFVGTFSAPELIFQLEQAPCEISGGELAVTPRGSVLVSYRGRQVLVQLVADCAGDSLAAAEACLEPFRQIFPEDAGILGPLDRVALREVTSGETFAAADVVDRVVELGDRPTPQFVVCPCAVPHERRSVIRSLFREVGDFLVSSSFGAVSAMSPSLHEQQDAEGPEGKTAPRNLSTAPHTIMLQTVLIEIVLSLASVVSPRFRPLPEPAPGMLGLVPEISRSDFCAPCVFAKRQRQRVAEAGARAVPKKVSGPTGPVEGASSQGADSAADAESPTPGDGQPPIAIDVDRVAVVEAQQNVLSSSVPAARSTSPTAPSAPMPSVGMPPAKSETPELPLLTAFLEVLDGDEDADGFEYGAVESRSEPSQDNEAEGYVTARFHDTFSTPCGQDAQGTGRADAVLSSLVNCVWLEPYAASLPRPPLEVVKLLSGVHIPTESPSDFAGDEKASSKASVSAASRMTSRALVLLLLSLFYEPHLHPSVDRSFADLVDPLLAGSRSWHTAAAAPLNFTQLLRALLTRLQEPLYALLMYSLIHRNEGFRRYCLCRADADEVLVPILEVLCKLPTTGSTSAPPTATGLLLTLLALSGDRVFCESLSRQRLADPSRLLGQSRGLRDVPLSSALISVLLRLAHWNFASQRDPFFNRTIAAILGNLARYGVEHIPWHTAGRLVDLAQLLAKNDLKAEQGDHQAGGETDAVRASMVRELLLTLGRLLSSCLRVPLVARNCALVYALMRAYPQQFTALELDTQLGPAFAHMRAVVEWFQLQCALSHDEDLDLHVQHLESTAARLPSAVDALSKTASTFGGFVYAETGASNYFLPSVWSAAVALIPRHVSWSWPRE